MLRRRTIRWSLAALACVLVAGYVWSEHVRDHVIPKRFGVVTTDRVYRSGQISRYLIDDVIAEHGIARIVDLTHPQPSDPDQQGELAAARAAGVEHLRYPLRGDGTGDIAHYARAIERIVESVEAGAPVLVHCAAGAQRTGGVIASYRLLVRGDPVDEVYEEMTRYGWRPGRDHKMIDYVNANMATLARLLREAGVIDRVPDNLPVLGPGS